MNASRYIFLLLISISCSSKGNRGVSIQAIKENSTQYAAKKDFRLSEFTVLETTSFLNTSFSIIDDKTGQIPLIFSKPLIKGQALKGVKVRYMQLYSDGQKTVEYLVDKKSEEKIAAYGPMVANFLFELSLKTLE